MATPDPKKQPAQKSDSDKPTSAQETHDKNVDQRERTKTSTKPPVDDENHGTTSYGQREGSTTSEDNDVE